MIKSSMIAVLVCEFYMKGWQWDLTQMQELSWMDAIWHRASEKIWLKAYCICFIIFPFLAMHFCVECNWWWVYVDHISTSSRSGLARCSLTQKKMRTRKKIKKGVEYEINVGLFWATHDDDVFQLFMHCRHKTTVKNQLVAVGKKTDQSGFLKT